VAARPGLVGPDDPTSGRCAMIVSARTFGARTRVVGATKEIHARNGRSVEVVGTYNPGARLPTLTSSATDRLLVSKGAKLSDRVSKLVASRCLPRPAAGPPPKRAVCRKTHLTQIRERV